MYNIIYIYMYLHKWNETNDIDSNWNSIPYSAHDKYLMPPGFLYCNAPCPMILGSGRSCRCLASTPWRAAKWSSDGTMGWRGAGGWSSPIGSPPAGSQSWRWNRKIKIEAFEEQNDCTIHHFATGYIYIYNYIMYSKCSIWTNYVYNCVFIYDII